MSNQTFFLNIDLKKVNFEIVHELKTLKITNFSLISLAK
jgi:hypothetical protein